MPQLDFRKPRLFVDAALMPDQTVALARDQSNYLGNVLRLSAGDTILVFNGRDGEWQASISGRKRPDGLKIMARTRPQDRLPDLAYVFAPLKHARLDYMVQKAVEMGVSSLQPVLTRFTQVSRVNGERMRANVIEAAEQCGSRRPGAARSLSGRAPATPPAGVLRRGRGAHKSAAGAAGRANRARGDRHPDRARRRICRGRARPFAAAATNLAAFARTENPARRHRGRGGACPGPGGARRLDDRRRAGIGSTLNQSSLAAC